MPCHKLEGTKLNAGYCTAQSSLFPASTPAPPNLVFHYHISESPPSTQEASHILTPRAGRRVFLCADTDPNTLEQCPTTPPRRCLAAAIDLRQSTLITMMSFTRIRLYYREPILLLDMTARRMDSKSANHPQPQRHYDPYKTAMALSRRNGHDDGLLL